MAVPHPAMDRAGPKMSIVSTEKFTELQGQYLAFLFGYSVLNRRPPAAADFRSFFCVAQPTVHRTVVELERRGLIRRTPRQARSIELCVADEDIPRLLPQSIVSAGPRYQLRR